MLPTEVQRILLLIGLAATGYLMILAWNEDYVQNPKALQYSAQPDFEGGDGSLAPPTDTSGADGQSATVSDVPDASLIGAAPPVSKVEESGSTDVEPATSRLIKVSTPTLEVWIDRLGGDIVRVMLPKFALSQDQPDVPYLLLNQGGGKTYVAQSGLVGPDGVDASGSRPLYSAASSEYILAEGEGSLTVDLMAELDEQHVTKRFEFSESDYLIEVDFKVENRGDRPLTTGPFAQIKRDASEPFGDKPIFLGPQPYLGAAFTTVESRYEKQDFEDLAGGTFRTTIDGGWAAFIQHYFLSAWMGEPDETNNYFGQARPDGTYVVGYTGPQRVVAPGDSAEWTSRLYVGPKDQRRLEEIAPNLNLTIDYGFLWWLAVPLFYLLEWFHGFTGNWGVAIILLTVLVKLVLYPLSAASYRSMANMRRVAPQMKRLQERYADDRQKLSQEMMALYKKEKVNPLGGCLPMLLPMPIFIALYWVLFESVELRHAPFFLWIDDLSAMDPYFILPLAMGASMYLQQLMSPAMGDPMQQRMMRIMPVMFTVLFLFFPAGLVLYWLTNNLLSIAQQYYVMRQTEEAHAGKS
jgi:YidC/Oxa1 family membrane protein insertase